jgi:hypothetical protein
MSDHAMPDKESGSLVDITALMQDCAGQLSLNEPFLSDPHVFNLHDAMAASQLMDRKMDSCDLPAAIASPWVYGKKNATTTTAAADASSKVVFPRPAPTGLVDAFTVLEWETLSIENAACIVTEIVVRLAALLNGASVGESTFTCLYAHQAVLLDMKERLQVDDHASLADTMQALSMESTREGVSETSAAQYVVFAAAYALVETTDIFRGIVNNADVYEEEDFASNTYGIPFVNTTNTPSRGYIATALEMLCQTAPGPAREIIQHALFFLSPFLHTCTLMGKLKRKNMTKIVRDLQAKARTALKQLQELEKVWSASSLAETPDYQRLSCQAFDSYMNRPLVGNAPVRTISFASPLESIRRLQRITEELDWAVCRLLLEANSMGRLVRILDRVSLAGVNILSRSLIVLNLYFEERLLGQYAMRTAVTDHMRQWEHLPDDLITNEHTHIFLNRLAKPVYDTLKLRASNRNRQRIYLESVMFNDWTSLQNEANLVDTHYRREQGMDNTIPPFFGYYVLASLIRLMDIHLSSAIDMDLFCGHEQLSSAFWYRDFILAALEQNLTAMKRAKEAYRTVAVAKTVEVKGKKKKNTKPKSNGKPVKKTNEELEDDMELRVIELKRTLCRGLVRFFVCLRKDGCLVPPTFEFTSLRQMFEKRFESFLSIRHPPPLTYDDYLAGADSTGIPAHIMLKSTAELFQAAKSQAESILSEMCAVDAYFAPIQEAEVRALRKVSVGNAVYLMKLQQQRAGSVRHQVAFDFDDHKEFCTIKLS